MIHYPRSSSVAFFLSLMLVLLLGAGSALAQAGDDNITNYVPEGDIDQREGEAGSGLDGTLGAAANVSLTSNSNVVGQVDGFSYLLGVSVLAGLDYVSGRHELRNTLKLSEAWSRTPVLDEMVKSNDVLDIESLYNYFWFDWAGPFARLNLETSILPTEAIKAEAEDFVINHNDGTTELQEQRERVWLADPFEPITLNQSVGFFVEPIQTEPLSLSVRLGFGARETFADGVLVETDNENTPEIELTELDNVFQGGGELFAGIDGGLWGKKLTYTVSAVAMVPFLNNDPEERGAFDLMRYGFYGGMSVSVAEWMAVNYQVKVLKDPQLLDELQVQNNLLLSFQYTFIEREPPALEEVDPQEELKQKAEAAEKRALEAEERARAAEERAAAAEAKAKASQEPAEPTEKTPEQ